MILRDSITAANIPTDTPVVAGYADGQYQWSANDWNRFPNSIRLSIVVSAAHQGDVLDVESGDATPAEAGTWASTWHPRPGRRRPTIYCNRDSWPHVKWAVGSTPVDYWISTLDGTTDVPGAVAVQYNDTGTYDESVILDETWVGDTLTDADRQDIASALTTIAYAAILNRDAHSDPTGQDYWFHQFVAGFGNAAAAFVSSPEAQHDLADEGHEVAGVDAERA